VGHRGNFNEGNTVNEWTNGCKNTNNNNNTGNSPAEIIIIETAIQSGVQWCCSTAKQIAKEIFGRDTM
jgi:hypothetical protein